jgi:hypothetical protein
MTAAAYGGQAAVTVAVWFTRAGVYLLLGGAAG